MIDKVYIGNPNQQDSVVQELISAVNKTPSGIFVVGGPCRVGKNTTIERVVTEGLGLPIGERLGDVIRPDVNMYDQIPKTYLRYWDDAYRAGQNVFAFGEIPINFQRALNHVADFYSKGRKDERHLKILFNVVSRNYPAWETEKIRSDIIRGLSRSFSPFLRDVHLDFLTADRDKIVDELWKLRNEGAYFRALAKQLGFDDVMILYEANRQNFEDFKKYIDGEMKGNISRTERW
jgi:hypothetical protein